YLSSLSVRRRRGFLFVAGFGNCAGDLSDRPLRFLSLADHRRTNVSQFSMGHLTARDRFLVDLSRAVAALAKARTRNASLSRRAVLLKLLLFKLTVMSGVVKLTSGDDCWWNLTALDYHYWSQPLPTVIGWWADQSPLPFKRFSVAFCLVVEIIVPFFIWTPRRLRLLACGLFVFLQITIATTGNYCFFNLLAIALCLLLIDDSIWRRKSATVIRLREATARQVGRRYK